MTTGASVAAAAVVGAGPAAGCSAAELVQETSAAASAATPHPRRPRRTHSSLADQLSTHQGRGRIVVVDGRAAHTRQVQRGTLTGYGLPARRTGLLVVILLLTVATVAGTVTQAAAARGGKPVAWVVPSTERVRIIAPAGSHSGAWLDAARGETESFQVAVRARGGPLTRASVSLSPLRRAGGGEISGGAVARYREHYVRVSRHSPAWSGRRVRWTWFPDALVPFVDPVTGRPPRAGAQYRAAPFPVAAGRNQPVWVDVTVPRDAAPGVYRGTWTVTSDQGRRSGPVTLRVRDFDAAGGAGQWFPVPDPAAREPGASRRGPAAAIPGAAGNGRSDP